MDEGMARPVESWEDPRPRHDDESDVRMMWDSHNICDDCWRKEEPYRAPVRLLNEREDMILCCYCGRWTTSGIVRRDNHLRTLCPLGSHR